MKVKFIKSASKQEDWIVDEKTEICFIGRSNCGKSSLINALAKQTVARSSSTPGRTQLVNFFDCVGFRLVDLPGYGFAMVSKKVKDYLQVIIQEYLLYRKNLFAVFQVCDANVITDDDARMSNFLQQRFINHFVILNKTDKHPMSTYQNNLARTARFLGIKIDNIIMVSAKKKTNIDLIEKKIKKTLAQIQK